MTTEPEVPLSAEEIAEPYGAAILAKFALCVARKCGHDITHHVGIPRRYLATIAAKDAALADVLSMSTCTKCGLRGVPTTYPVGGGPEPLKLVYRCSNEDCGYCVPPPMSAKIESLESQLRDANRRASESVAPLHDEEPSRCPCEELYCASCGRRRRKTSAWATEILASAEAKLREAERWQREHDSAIDAVVQTCLDSRNYPEEQQAAYLRDRLLTQFDPLMMVTRRLTAALQSAQEEK